MWYTMINQEKRINPVNQKPMFHHSIKTLSCILVLFMVLLLPDIQAQNSTSSPYTIFGIGEIEYRDFGRTTGMGSVGIGFQSENYLNRRNPAGLSGIDTLRFILDVSAAVKLSEFRTSSRQSRTNDFNFRNLAVGVRLSKRWASSVGLGPYSNVGYHINDEPASFSGSGGVNKFYWANAFEIFRGFSLGVTSSYIFGNIIHDENQEAISRSDKYNIDKIYFDFGAQYTYWFGDHTNITVGGVYGYETGMALQWTKVITSNNATELNQRMPDVKSFVPESYGAGFSILRNKKAAEWVFAADYHFKGWSVDRTSLKGMTYTDSHVYSVGLQFTPNKKRPENIFQATRYQLGACYNQSYLKVNGAQLEDYSVSFGVGVPFRNLSYVNFAVNVGESNTGFRGGITERYVLFSLNLSLIERWFAKHQWD